MHYNVFSNSIKQAHISLFKVGKGLLTSLAGINVQGRNKVEEDGARIEIPVKRFIEIGAKSASKWHLNSKHPLNAGIGPSRLERGN